MPTNEEIMGKVVASGGEGYDVLFVSSPVRRGARQARHRRASSTTPRSPTSPISIRRRASCKHDPGNTFSVPYTWGTTGLCYRSDLVKTEPTSWNDLLKPADDLKGKTTMLSTDRWLMAAGLQGARHSVNETDPAEARQGQGRC